MGLLLHDLTRVVKHEAGPGHDQRSHGSWAWGRAEDIVASIRKFREAGGKVNLALPDEGEELLGELEESWSAIVDAYEQADLDLPDDASLGKMYTERAFEGMDRNGYAGMVAYDKDGNIAGGLAFQQGAGYEDIPFEVEYLGSLGSMPGVGSALMAEIILLAAGEEAGISLIPDAGAVSWYRDQFGMEVVENPRSGDYSMTLSAENVAEMAKGIRTLLRATA